MLGNRTSDSTLQTVNCSLENNENPNDGKAQAPCCLSGIDRSREYTSFKLSHSDSF